MASLQTLILIPTELERARLVDAGGFPSENALTAICGFGVAAAAARTAALIARHAPREVLLIGIAGAYDTDAHPTGSAHAFDIVATHGIGAGEGPTFQGPSALGFPQWPASDPASEGGSSPSPVDDHLPLATPNGAGLLLTTCAASDSPARAADLQERHPGALAEDMEGFGVAIACHLGHTPCWIVRGISNQVGDRDAAHWRIPAALQAARDLALELLAGAPA
jgi:futalosine hydrolase